MKKQTLTECIILYLLYTKKIPLSRGYWGFCLLEAYKKLQILEAEPRARQTLLRRNILDGPYCLLVKNGFAFVILCERFLEGVRGNTFSREKGSPASFPKNKQQKRSRPYGRLLFCKRCINYLYLRFLAASDFFLRFTLGFS